MNASKRLLFIYFLDCDVSNKTLDQAKNQTSCTSFLQTAIWCLSNYSGCLPRSSLPEVFRTRLCSVKWCDKIYLFSKSGQKHESATCKFTINYASSQVFPKEFDLKFRRSIFKSTFRWLLPRTTNIPEWLLLIDSYGFFKVKASAKSINTQN